MRQNISCPTTSGTISICGLKPSAKSSASPNARPALCHVRSLWPGPAQQHFLDQMRDLQDALGTLNDISLAEAALERRETLAPSQSLRADLALTAAARMWQLLGTLPPWWATP